MANFTTVSHYREGVRPGSTDSETHYRYCCDCHSIVIQVDGDLIPHRAHTRSVIDRASDNVSGVWRAAYLGGKVYSVYVDWKRCCIDTARHAVDV
ncbi:MAG TPA: hypothetical protein VJT33_01740 [bacterium]|nr:hypothetical protein [bacterium]